jgi:hypothetical protein
MDYSDYDLDSFANMDPGGMDLGGIENMDFGGLDGLDLSGLAGMDFDSLGLEGLDLGGLESLDLGGLEGLDLSGLEGMDFDSLGLDSMDLGDLSGGDSGLSRSMVNLGDGAKTGGVGFKPTGRGRMSVVDPETGVPGLSFEGFTSGKDLLGSGTAEQIARYTPGSVDYSSRSGLDTSEGQGLSSDATRGMGLEYMGGGQGISNYVPAEYAGSVLEDLVKSNPGKFGEIEDYLNGSVSSGAGLTPFKGTGGTQSAAGFLNQSSAKNPLGAQYSIGDPKSIINRPSVTGQQATVSPGRTVIDNKDGTFKVVTEKDGELITKTVDDKGKVVTPAKPATPAKPTTPAKTDEKGLGSLLPLLLALLAMNKGGGSSGEGKATVIPGLTATQRQTPYAQQQSAPGYRPGQGGIRYFDQTQYTPKMAAGGIARLLQGPGDGVSDSIPAVITDGMSNGGQPAKVARGEYIMDARTVAALGNGSTDAGAERLDKMRQNILRDDRQAGVGKDSKAYRHLMA